MQYTVAHARSLSMDPSHWRFLFNMTRQLIYHNVIYHQDFSVDQLCINLFSSKQYEGWSILGFTMFEKLTENSFAEIVDGTQNPV